MEIAAKSSSSVTTYITAIMASARANFRLLLGGRGALDSGAGDKKVYLEAPDGWPPQKNMQWCTASRTFPSP